jgi:hypothetical protein
MCCCPLAASTLLAHPLAAMTAQQVEGVVRANGAVPATIAVLEGVPHIGLTAPQLERLARAGTAVRKVSRRDLPLVCALGLDGATTVSATMLLAARAGIAVFVTGGGCCLSPPDACNLLAGSPLPLTLAGRMLACKCVFRCSCAPRLRCVPTFPPEQVLAEFIAAGSLAWTSPPT